MDPSQVKGVIAAFVSPKEPALESEFNRWMDEVHCANAAETPGCLAWTRYKNIAPQPGQPTHLNLYEFDRADAGAAKAWLLQNMARKREQGRMKPVTSTYQFGAYTRITNLTPKPGVPEGLVVVMTACLDKTLEAEYNRWYDTQHMPAILTTPGMTGGMRFKAQHCDGTPADYLQLFFIGSPDVPGARAAMTKTLGAFPESVRSSAGLAKPVLVAAFQRMGQRHAVCR